MYANVGSLTLTDTVFSRGLSWLGGAVYMISGRTYIVPRTRQRLDISAATFKENSATYLGAAFMLSAYPEATAEDTKGTLVRASRAADDALPLQRVSCRRRHMVKLIAG